MLENDYDYLIAGTGCAGLSLAVHLLREPGLQEKKILLVDRVQKTKNDRTWCFWEKEPGPFEDIVRHRWERLWFHGEGESRLLSTAPYQYKLIRGIDFYNYCFDFLSRFPGVHRVQAEVEQSGASILLDGHRIQARYAFSSIPTSLPENPSYWKLLQHFKGWVIKTPGPVFDPAAATLMDFRVNQHGATAFVYCMPFSETEALVEYTLFSDSLLQPSQYEEELSSYLKNIIKLDNYEVLEKEFGIIPMTDQPFPKSAGNIYYIGTAGGCTKPSSGYTFQFIQQRSSEIARSLALTGSPSTRPASRRFSFYDRILLNVLGSKKMKGEKVFSDLFRNNTVDTLFPFLDNQSNLLQELRVIGSLPVGPFFRAACQELSSRKD
ncbi:MAG: lycopene cyclase [Bacteroidetes bacterium]|nr:lycopene cyclase [Bacteroidota bacterium]